MKQTLQALSILAFTVAELAAEPVPIALDAPRPHQVVQRGAFDPVGAASVKIGAPAFGHADVAMRATVTSSAADATWEYRVTLLSTATGKDVDWTPINVRLQDGVLKTTARVPAGGWYRIELRCRSGREVTHQGAVEPVGVGEVFLVAGQSYATNCNDEKLKVADPQGRVVAFDSAKSSWRVAHDPQPTPDASADGSIWPPVGDFLVQEFCVPVGFANVAFGGTASSQWMPDGELHRRLVAVGRELGGFRCVLWQQGESDVIAKTTTAKYIENVRAIRKAAASVWQTEAQWLLAKSTHHPTVYNDPEGEGRIRAAIDALTSRPGFLAGPDTDRLTGENRGDAKSRRHFSAVGQGRAAELWLAVLKPYLHAPPSVHENLPALKLLEPVWSSPVVHRESSVLLKMKPDGPAVARLAFPAAEVLEVATADRQHRFEIGRDFALSADGLALIFTRTDPVIPIAAAELFPPKDSPNSYRHRVGQPDANLLYRPGRWFHDHNIEVTYRRKVTPAAPSPVFGTLPRTLARLKAGTKLVIGVSGDSISTGLDASGMTKAPPFQPGYPDLVTAQLRAASDSEVVLRNRAVSGWSVANGVADLDKLVAEKPDLIVVAYGMNDVGRRDPKWIGQQTRELLARVRKALPEAEVLLVSPMLGNVEWVHTPRAMFGMYRDELKSMTGPGVALADVTAVWELLLTHKHDLDLTGNGLNHPNDFGHRVYAQMILRAILDVPALPVGK